MRKIWHGAASGWYASAVAGSLPMARLMTSLGPPAVCARRELRGGMRGFRIFFLCLLLGTAAIAGVESLSDAFLNGLRDQGQTFLGGDVAVHLVHRAATPEEQAFLQGYGKISTSVSM